MDADDIKMDVQVEINARLETAQRTLGTLALLDGKLEQADPQPVQALAEKLARTMTEVRTLRSLQQLTAMREAREITIT